MLTKAYEQHRFSKVIPGGVDTVRDRVADVLEQFNYVVLGGNPLQAKRDRQKNILTAGVLEYRATLTIAFKPISAASTQATFDYSVEYLFTKGDRLTLEREADAIIAMTLSSLRSARCPSCDEENASGVRFCRVCGTPLGRNNNSPELEVLRLTAGANAARQEISLAVIIGLLSLIVTLPVILLTADSESEVAVSMVVLGGLGESLATFFLLHGIARLGRTLKQAPTQPGVLSEYSQMGLLEEKTSNLAQRVSVTEGTTELMDRPHSVSEFGIKSKDTDSMDR